MGVGALKNGLLGVYWSPSAFFRVSQVWGFCRPWFHSGGSWSSHRSEAGRALLSPDNSGKSRHKIPIPSFPTLFSHGPAAFCPRPRYTHLAKRVSSTSYQFIKSIPLPQTGCSALAAPSGVRGLAAWPPWEIFLGLTLDWQTKILRFLKKAALLRYN